MTDSPPITPTLQRLLSTLGEDVAHLQEQLTALHLREQNTRQLWEALQAYLEQEPAAPVEPLRPESVAEKWRKKYESHAPTATVHTTPDDNGTACPAWVHEAPAPSEQADKLTASLGAIFATALRDGKTQLTTNQLLAQLFQHYALTPTSTHLTQVLLEQGYSKLAPSLWGASPAIAALYDTDDDMPISEED